MEKKANFFCSYCGQTKSGTEQTDEHVIPQKIGGAVSPVNPFKLKTVCRGCNSTCGFYVDGPFVMNSLVYSHHALRAMEFVNVEEGEIAPLSYLGFWQEDDVKLQELDCEMWLGPTGDCVIHYHKPYPAIPGTLGMVSVKSVKDIDPGFVIVFLASNNPVWHPTIFKSILAHFSSNTKIYFANTTFTAGSLPENVLPLDAERKALIEKIKAALIKNGGGAKVQQAIDIGFAQRYQAKAALGFGSLFLNPDFQTSSYAKFLREYLWTKTTAEREGIPLRGKGILSEDNSKMMNACGIYHGVTAILMPVGDGIALAMNFFSQFDFLVMVSDDPNHWPQSLDQNGIALVLISGLKKCVGPIPFIEFVSGVLGGNHNSPVYKLIEEAESLKRARPPHMI